MNEIDITNLYIKKETNNVSEAGGSKKKSGIQISFSKLIDDLYRKKTDKNSKAGKKLDTKTILYADNDYIYKDDVICNSCAKKKTSNNPGIECYAPNNVNNKNIRIKVKCKSCSHIKNSYINKNTLDENILQKFNENLLKFQNMKLK